MEETKQLICVQEDRFEQIKKARTNYHKSPKQRISTIYLETRIDALDKVWQTFTSTHDQLVSRISKEQRSALKYFSEDIYEECEELYISYKCDLKTKLLELTPRSETRTATNEDKTPSAKIKLPTITIPAFSGKYTDWPSFHDLFNSLIHSNSAIDDVQKLHYLKTNLSGEAEQLLRSIPITSQNYNQAWETLKNRYNNKRFISNCVFKKLFGIRTLSTESAFNIRQLLDNTIECLNSLNNLGLPTQSWDAIIIYLTVSKLDTESHRLWEQQLSAEHEEFPSFTNLKNFLETRFRSLEMIEHTNKSVKPKTFHTALDSIVCSFCKEEHYIYQCKSFAKLSYKERYDFVQNHNLCFNCLIPNHSAAKCMRDTSCRICKRRHHSLLHPEKRESVDEKCHNDSSSKNIVSHFMNQPGPAVLLATALVDITSRDKQTYVYRALLDQGSQASFVTEDLVQTLGLKRVKINGEVSGLSEGNTVRIKYMVECKIKSRHDSTFTIPVQAYVLNKISNYLPSQSITVVNWPELRKIQLADPGFHTPNKIDLLLGAEIYSKIIDTGLIKGPTGILAQYTHLGWILSGDTSNTKSEKEKQMISMHLCMNENEILRKFWEIEHEILTSERKLTKEEEKCEEIYRTTTTRTPSGRYKVNLPFKDESKTPVEICGRTKESATFRFLQLEKRFKHDTKLKEEYTKVIKEYLTLGHMILAEEDKSNTMYLPHHAVIRNDKDTTKVRVVFDGSAKGSKGHSLNDTLLSGPVIQQTLHTLITKWRQHKIAIVSDIVKMYRQVLVTEEHAEYQRIVWRDHPHEDLKSYKLLTVTFGTTSAPFLAVRTLVQAAQDEGEKYPLAAEIVKTSFFVDDLMSGGHDEDMVLAIYSQVNQLLKSAGFELQKWSSNSDKFLEVIKQNKGEMQPFEIKFDQYIKILGVLWDRNDDKFKFTICLPEVSNPITKRRVLSDVARLFDPFGWLAPIIIKAKIFIQKLWLCTAGWDDELPPNLKTEWFSYRQELNEIPTIELDRWIHTHPNNDVVELHGFADASTAAYAAVLYVKVIQGDKVVVTILESKTKVAPLRQISVARLELCAVVLLARLLSEASHNLLIPENNIFAYTDSTVVLAWLQSQPTKWQTFVANRVSEVQARLANDRWRHVASAENPADIASRGTNPTELKDNKLWWKGPQWLEQRTISITNKTFNTNLERKKQPIEVFVCEVEDSQIMKRFSSLNRMIRVLTYCRRFLRLKIKKNIRQQQETYLTSEEMRETLMTCIKLDQKRSFSEELEDLARDGKVKRRSKLISLAPYIDDKGVLRVGGRLEAANLPHNTKHPIIIPNKSHLATLMVRDAHLRLLHGSLALTVNYLRNCYWIIGAKSMVKKCYRDCVTCTRYKGTTQQPLMGDLPKARVTPGKPFKTSGVDFAGPIQMRVSKGRGQKSYKGYICLFVCMKTKAIHLEPVSDLTSQGFLAAFRRFVARRGYCSDLWSDNGLNFVGGARDLKGMFKESTSGVAQEVAELLANDHTIWHFIPPRAPNFGGLWEAGIKSVQRHLIKVIGNSTLTFEEMSTLLCQIEACLNSRPLCQLNDNPEDLTPLTPAHFLVGEPTVLIPEKYDAAESISPLQRWRQIQRMMKTFWDRWSREFLHTMQQRPKWRSELQPPRIGDVVIVKDTDLPPSKWLLAKITELHPGPDDNVRVVTIKCKGTTLKRPLSKLISLPREDMVTHQETGPWIP